MGGLLCVFGCPFAGSTVAVIYSSWLLHGMSHREHCPVFNILSFVLQYDLNYVYLSSPSWNTDQGVYCMPELGIATVLIGINVNALNNYSGADSACGLELSRRACSRTRKMVNYSREGWGLRKLRRMLVTVLTCKSFVSHWCRGERLIEPSSSWFLPKFPSG